MRLVCKILKILPAMSDSVSTKSIIVINAIAITAALAVISGYVPFKMPPLAHMQSLLEQGGAAPRY